ncbi:PREDICTED: cytochrome P450 2D6-like [Branchiostoma belcheri]|uniref:Cytochrome P450 2D6-like n=1 Tax=Branchiostoma belcheri TaxID=7741 RepID=A0A6P4Y5D2_BRABE|nr:PREDICTED: cytochrome P450 2D6-like [Branchiostoma belcheri]
MAGVVRWMTESLLETLQISGLTLQSFFVFCVAFFLACFLLKSRRNLPPYPAARVPVLGHILALGRAPYLKLTAWRRQCGDVFTVRMGVEDVVVLNGYTAVKDALVDRSDLFASRAQIYLADALLGFGKDIVTARWGAEFKQRKRFATAALKNLGMKVGTGSIEEKIAEEASCLRNRITDYNGKLFDISHDVTVAVANVICSMVMGKRYDYQDETFRELAEAVVTIMAGLGGGQIISVFPVLRFVPVVNRAGINALEEVPKVLNVLREEISRHRGNLDRDFLDFCLLEVEKQEKVEGLTEENVLYMALDLFLAGIDTTTNTLMWSLLYMVLNPDIQHKVQQELDAVVGEGLPTLSHRSQLPYVNACLLEVMRIRPIGPLSHHATTDSVKVQKYDIPKGTQVVLNLYSIHMDPAYWPDPDRFDPGRFLDAEGNCRNKPESFMVFGGGRRVCLGEQLGRMEIFLFFSTLLQSFSFRTPEGTPRPKTDGVFGVTLAPHPFKICAIPR